MTRMVLTGLALVAVLSPAMAQTPPAPQTPPPAGENGFMDGLLGDLLPRLQERLGELSGYEAPEILPNGDILIRKSPSSPPPPSPVPGTDGEVEL